MVLNFIFHRANIETKSDPIPNPGTWFRGGRKDWKKSIIYTTVSSVAASKKQNYKDELFSHSNILYSHVPTHSLAPPQEQGEIFNIVLFIYNYIKTYI